MKMRYFSIRKPSNTTGHKKFRIVEHVDNLIKTVHIDELDSINDMFLAEVLNYEQTYKKVKELLCKLYAARDKDKPVVVHSAANLRVIEHYWDVVYSDRELVDKKGMLIELKRAVGCLGHLSLITANKQELQSAITDRYKDSPNNQRRTVARLNSILAFLNRKDVKLSKVRESPPKLGYISFDEFDRLSTNLPEPFRILCGVAISTGCRLGEIFMINANSVAWSKNYINVTSQLDRSGVSRSTKTRRSRKAIIIPQGIHWIKKWVELSENERLKLRHLKHAKKLRLKFKQDLKFHDLRHSYAIHLLSQEVPLSLVAQSLGNSYKVCEKYYTGFELANESIETVNRILSK